MIVLRMALRRPDDVPAIVLAAAAGLSIGNVWGRNLLSVFSTIRPGRLAARYRRRVSRSPLLRRLVFGFVSVADPVGLTDQAVEGFLAAQLLHTDIDSAWQALRADDPREELEAVRCPVARALGCRGRAAAARRRVRVHATPTCAPAGDPRLRTFADRRAT